MNLTNNNIELLKKLICCRIEELEDEIVELELLIDKLNFISEEVRN